VLRRSCRWRGVREGALLLALAGSAGLASAQAPSAAASEEWRQFRGDHRLTGVASSSLPASLKVLWKYETRDSIVSSAAIAGGAVYVGVGNGDLVSLELSTGKLRWKYSTGSIAGIGESSPAVSADAVYVGDLDGSLHAVSARDGKRLWAFKAEAEIKSSPTLVNDLVLVGSYDSHLYALEAKTGKVRWKYKTEGMVHATPSIVGDLAFIAGCDEVFRAIRISDGKQAYSIRTEAYAGASPAINGDRAYFGAFTNEVLALDLKARKVLWTYSHPDREFPFYSSAALTNGRVIVGGRDKAVHALDAATGKRVWEFLTRARVDSSPVVVGDRVFVGSNDGKVYALDTANGQKRWEFDAGAPVSASPAVAANRMVIGAQDGVIYCFG
jgi:outer membrane protein assembly factor BamB